MPEKLKEAVLKPKLKKDSLECEEYTNCRRISNLKVLSKVSEKAAASQLLERLANNNLEEPLQSAYKRFHSTETAVLITSLIKYKTTFLWPLIMVSLLRCYY